SGLMLCVIAARSRPGAQQGRTDDESAARTENYKGLSRLYETGSWRLMNVCCLGNRLFETHPECKDVFFLFRDVEDLDRLRTSRELRAHGLRVMSFIEKSVARLEQLERLEVLAVELGRSHYRSNAPPKYYSYVGAEFICAVQPILKERWTPELEEAWKPWVGLGGHRPTHLAASPTHWAARPSQSE
uniref:X globin n=1 Tax=Salmo trutta TaxID=8032 RepID=A0A673Z148_SALTR